MSTSSASKIEDDVPIEYNLQDCNGLIATQWKSLQMKFFDEGREAEDATAVIVQTANELTDDCGCLLEIVFRQVARSFAWNIPTNKVLEYSRYSAL